MNRLNFIFITTFLTFILLSIHVYSQPESCTSQDQGLFHTPMQIFRHLWRHGEAASTNTQWEESHGTIYQFTEQKDIDGEVFDFSKLKGKVIIITNVACDCGFTKSGYQHLVQWQKDFDSTNAFTAIGFPSNSFDQEKRLPSEIKQYVTDKFGLNFPLMEKSDVNGDNTNPVYAWLKKSFPGDITWNFSTYLVVSHEGIPIRRFEKEKWEDIKAFLDTVVAEAQKAQGTTTTPSTETTTETTPTPAAETTTTPATETTTTTEDQPKTE